MFDFHSREVVHESYVQGSTINIDFEKIHKCKIAMASLKPPKAKYNLDF